MTLPTPSTLTDPAAAEPVGFVRADAGRDTTGKPNERGFPSRVAARARAAIDRFCDWLNRRFEDGDPWSGVGPFCC